MSVRAGLLVLSGAAVLLSASAAAQDNVEWSFVLGATYGGGDINEEFRNSTFDDSLNPGYGFSVSIERLSNRFGIGLEQGTGIYEGRRGNGELQLNHTLVNGLLVLPFGDRWRAQGALGVGLFENNLDFDSDGTDWTPGAQIRGGIEGRLGEKNWIGLRGRYRYTQGVEGIVLGRDAEFNLSSGDIELTYRRTY